MAQLAIMNPRDRRGRFLKRKRKRTSSRRRTTARRRTRVNPRQRRSSRRRNAPTTVIIPVKANPKRRRRAATSKRRGRRRVRRNPRGGAFSLKSIIGQDLIPASMGAVGALGVDMLWGYLPIPDALKAGVMAPVARLAAAVGVGYFAGMLGGKRFGQEVTVGAITVTAYDLFKGFLQANVPSIHLSDYVGELDYLGPAMTVDGMGNYVELDQDGMGNYVELDQDM